MKVVYLHGLNSSPESYKRQYLENQGYDVHAPSLPADNWEQSVLNARQTIADVNPDVVVGSSRGAAVAMAARGGIPLILIAPAWKKYAPWSTIAANTIILHSEKDNIIKFTDSVDLAHAFGAMLVEVGEDHRMNDEDTLTELVKLLQSRAGPSDEAR